MTVQTCEQRCFTLHFYRSQASADLTKYNIHEQLCIFNPQYISVWWRSP